MRRGIAAALTLGVLAFAVVAGTHMIAAWADHFPRPQLEWAYIPRGVPGDAPFAAWYAVKVPDAATRTWVQLRICDEGARCVLGARKAITGDAAVGLVTASRSLAPGSYTLDLLVVSEDRLGAARTVQLASSQVQYAK